MRQKTYFLIIITLLLILGIFAILGIVSSRRIMLNLITEEAHSFLSMAVMIQENAIFGEGRLEDEIIDKLLDICEYLEDTQLNQNTIDRIVKNFELNSIIVFDRKTKRIIAKSGQPIEISNRIFDLKEPVYYEYFKVGHKKEMLFIYQIPERIYQIELPADVIEDFRKEFGLNKIINQIMTNPMVKYLVLQDQKGIIFATPNIHTVTSITDDTLLNKVIKDGNEQSRIIKFNDKNILELIRPFGTKGKNIGLFRLGISLEGYYRHMRETERQLILLFAILLVTGFILFFFLIKYQSFLGLKEIFDKTLGAVEDGVLMVDKKGSITGVNPSFCSVTSFDEKALLGQNYFSLFKNDPLSIKKVLEQGTKIVDEHSIFGRNIQYATYPLFDNQNRIIGSISVMRDVTRLRAFEKEREEAERFVFLGNLVANFAHEIKNPLNGLSIATQRLIREFPSKNSEYQQLTSTIKKEIEFLNKTLNDFLTLARPGLKEKKQFNLSQLLIQTLDLIGEQIMNMDIELKKEIVKGLEISGNEEDFRRAILNILLNAIDALSIITEKKKLIVRLRKTDGEILLEISDNGVGMEPEEIEKIFTPYFTTKQGGTGLGLYIAQKIIRDHKGRIEVKSKKGQGTSFFITLSQ